MDRRHNVTFLASWRVLHWNQSQNYWASPAIREHTALATCHPTEVNTSQADRYSILVILPAPAGYKAEFALVVNYIGYQNDLPVRRRSPIQVVTGPGVEQLCWSRSTRWPVHHHAACVLHTFSCLLHVCATKDKDKARWVAVAGPRVCNCLWMWVWMWILNLYSAISCSISIALSTLVFREKYSFQTTPKAAAAERWITETVR